MIYIPTSIIPGCLLSGLFAFIGMFCSLPVSSSITEHRFQPLSLVALPLLPFSVWLIVYIWRGQPGALTASQATRLSHKLLAGMLALSLLVGLFTGGLIGTLGLH